MSIKRELVIYSDLGLIGTFVSWQEKATEKNYVFLEYVPLGFRLKKIILEKAIHRDHIHILHSSSSIKGVESRIIFIYTGEQGSLITDILKSDSEKLIFELREQNKKLQMQVASSKQNEEDARSGVNKTLQSMKSVSRPTSSPSYDGYPNQQRAGYPQGQPEFEGFDDF